MRLRSLGLRTDLFFLRHQAEVIDRGAYLVVRSPTEPRYYWGNLLVFPAPPGPGDADRWPALFTTEFGELPAVRHMTLAWDGVDGDLGTAAEFYPAGFELDEGEVLVTAAVGPPPHPTPGVEVRPLEREAEWEAVVRCGVLCRDLRHDAVTYEGFVRKRLAAQRRLVGAGCGRWFGAFRGSALVADLGLFVEDGVARYQSVQTHPDHQRQGLCGVLVSAAAAWARQHLGAETYVMVADPDYHAARVYKSVGFATRERVGGLCRYPPEPSA